MADLEYKEYEDFSILITREEGRFLVRVLQSPAGKGSGALALPPELTDVGSLVSGLARTARGFAPEGESGSSSDLSEIGSRLYAALFQAEGKVGPLYQKSLGQVRGKKGLRIRLNLDLEHPEIGELARLPWEFLKGDTYLNLSDQTPVVRDLVVAAAPDPLDFEEPLRVLVVVSNPAGSATLDLEQEGENLDETLAGDGITVDIVRNVGKRALQDYLDTHAAYHVLHYMGHGAFEGGRGCLLLEAADGGVEKVFGSDLEVMLHDKSDVTRLVFLNACQTAITSTDDGADPFGGVATSLIEAGIPAVVAMQFPISDRAAIDFSKTFYERIVRGYPVDTAVQMARRMLRLEFGEDNFEWGTPVLFMCSEDGFLFKRNAAPLAPLDLARGEDYAVRLSEEAGFFVLEWEARDPTPHDFVALYKGQPERADAYLWEQYEYAGSGSGRWRTAVSARPGYYVGYVSVDAEGKQALEAIAGSS